jgi:cytochrome c biogenesis protein CcmG/thiol:disulfide interchange protein DsbE
MYGIVKTVLLALWCQMIMVTPAWSVEVGEPMPDFGIKTLAGDNLSRASLAGKPLLLVFWNTWCPNCKEELPLINRLAGKFAPGELTVLAINTGLNDSENKARAFWQKSGYLFPTGFDRHFDTVESFGIRGVPTVLLVDASGVVRYKSPQLPDNMEERLRQLKQ